MNQPVRRKTDADATETNQFDVTGIFCGKLLRCPVRNRTQQHQMKESRIDTGLFAFSTVKPHTGMAAMRSAPDVSRTRKQEGQHRACPVLIELEPKS